MKRKKRTNSTAKKTRSASAPYPDNDPEWDNLEERYSQINDDMRKLAHIITLH